MFGESLVSQGIEFSASGVPLDSRIEMSRVKCSKPGAQPCKLVRCEPFDRFLDFFGGCHETSYNNSVGRRKDRQDLLERDVAGVVFPRKYPHGFVSTAMIRKLQSGRYRLYSRKTDPKTGKRRNLGTFKSRTAAEKHERAVQYFKRH